MARTAKWRRGFGEFLIIVAGVIVGLAADEWRESLQDRARESDYLERLEADLLTGRARIEPYALRFSEVAGAVEQLIGVLESRDPVVDTAAFLALTAQAGASGFDRDGLVYSATYDELIATGNLGIIRNRELRRHIVEHFRVARTLVEDVEELPMEYNVRLKSLTGLRPAAYPAASGPYSHQTIDRVLRELLGNEEVLSELRHFQAEFAEGSFFQEALNAIDELLSRLDSSHGAV